MMPAYGAQAALARNGMHVLQAMHDGILRGKGLRLSPSGFLLPLSAKEGVTYAGSDSMGLTAMLPWLPAYDRRDALVVQSLLDEIAFSSSRTTSQPHTQRSDNELLCALAASCYAAARMRPSDGDPADDVDLLSWIKQMTG